MSPGLLSVEANACLLLLLAMSLGADVVRRVAQGDVEALRGLYRAHEGRVMALALGMLRSRAEAEDIVQDTFVEVWRRAHEHDVRRGEPGAWIMAIARSRSIDRLRRAKVRRLHAQAEAAAPESQTPASARAPETEVGDEQRAHQVRAKLRALPEEQRRVIELAFYEGLTHVEIAQRTHVPLGTVKSRLRAGMEKLTNELEALR